MPRKVIQAKIKGPYAGAEDIALTVDPTASKPGPGAVLVSGSLTWDDGTPPTIWTGPPRLTDHRYTTAGTFLVTLTVVDSRGRSAMASTTASIIVTPPTPLPVGVPSVPTGLTITPGNTQNTISWSHANNATSYNVQRSLSNGGPYTPLATVTVQTYVDTGLVNGTTYFYVVSASNAVGTSANSVQVSGTPESAAVPPAAPTITNVTPGSTEVSLVWTTSALATSYTVKRSTTNGGPYTTVASGLTGTSYTNTGLSNGTTYYYVVTASNTAGESSNSNQATATTSTPESLPVVPNAFGYGMTTRAAYGGLVVPTVYRVTNLNDAGSGSLRAALEASVPRVVIFEISGTIPLNSELYVTNPYITIAGQTAPSPGITLRDFGITITTHDVLVQHLRIRIGDEGPAAPANQGPDGLFVYSAAAYNVVLANNSISWVCGESTGTVSPHTPTVNVTYWRNIISEALHFSSRVDENSHGMIVYSDTAGYAAIGNLFAHNVERNPEQQENSSALYVNNVMYDWGHTDQINFTPSAMMFYHGGRVSGPFFASAAGNKFIKGPTMPAGKYGIYTWSGDAGSQLYLSDNAVEGVTLYGNNMSFDPRVGTSPISLSGITILPSNQVENFVVANAGARPADRDAVDLRIVSDVQSRSGSYISSQATVGGWPTLAVNTRALTLPGSPHAITGSGYTNLEVWLHDFSATVGG